MIFISIESFLKLGGLVESVSVGALLLEETCELASKMLSATCPTPLPFRLLRTIAQMAQRVLYTDADFEADGRCITFARYLCPSLPLRIFTLKHTVELSKRSAKFFFHHPTASAESNYEAWLAQLKAYLKKWKRTGGAAGNRVACALSTRTMVTVVCQVAQELGLHCGATTRARRVTTSRIKSLLTRQGIGWTSRSSPSRRR